MNAARGVGEMNGNSSVLCLLTNSEGTALGEALYLPENVGPPQLQEIVNKLLQNVGASRESIILNVITLVDSSGTWSSRNILIAKE
ncbi:hypothetical protein HPP92_026601 [Vanilla planifolia]|uniref:NLE domain-containing protein n=1 Tax=Vanilla planifolia TaxID=51239 RepID=A0A835PBQ3_VANPL|nr:hypothetical protein HPP92_026601 [Vanilla planifolia]